MYKSVICKQEVDNSFIKSSPQTCVKNETASTFTFEPIFWPVTDQLLLTMQNLSTLDRRFERKLGPILPTFRAPKVEQLMRR